MWCQICLAVKPAAASQRGLPFLRGFRSAAHPARLAHLPILSFVYAPSETAEKAGGFCRGEQKGLVVATQARYATPMYHLNLNNLIVQPKSEVVWNAGFKLRFDVKYFSFQLATTSNKTVTVLLQLREKRGQHKMFLVPKAKNQEWQNLCGKKPPGRASGSPHRGSC